MRLLRACPRRRPRRRRQPEHPDQEKTLADPLPTPAFSTPLPSDVAARIRKTAPRRTPRRLAALVLAAGVLGGAFSVALPAGDAQAMRSTECWYKGWFVEDGIWYYGWFLESC